MTGSRGMLAAKDPLVVPMLLRLSHFKLSSYVVLVVSKQKGITLVFKTDPLQNVDINSTFDNIAVIQKFIQREIEGQLRQMFREDLPGIIHRLSQQWVKAKVEAPYLNTYSPPPSMMQSFDTTSAPEVPQHLPRIPSVGLQPYLARQRSLPPWGYGRARSSSAHSIASVKSAPPSQPSPQGTFPDLENFDPTYGLRPEGLPNKSVFGAFGRLFTPDKGLADLAEAEEENFEEEFSVVDWEDTFPDFSPPSSVQDLADRQDEGLEYETIPAVGGGTVTRPRIYHSQSLIQATSDNLPSTGHPLDNYSPSSEPPLRSATLARFRNHISKSGPLSSSYGALPGGVYGRSRSVGGIGELYDFHANAVSEDFPLTSPQSPDSLENQASDSRSTRSLPTPPYTDQSAISSEQPQGSLRPSTSNFDQSFQFQSSSPPNSLPEPDPEIVLRPSLNNSVHQLSTLSHSNHTLSPFTRSLEHFTVRSVPPRCSMATRNTPDRQPARARRKRTHRLGEQIPREAEVELRPPSSPTPPSEFDASDMDRYFRSHDAYDDVTTRSPPAPHVRRRLPPS
jgi:distribution and morphology protein 34